MCLGLVGLLIHSFFMLLFFVFILYFFFVFFFFSSRRRHTRCLSDWSSDVCSSDLRNSKPPQAGRESSSQAFPWPQPHSRFLQDRYPIGSAASAYSSEDSFSSPLRHSPRIAFPA